MNRTHPFVPGAGATLNTCQDCGRSADSHALALIFRRDERSTMIENIARMFPSPHRFKEPHL